MNIVKHETVELSEEEKKAFNLISDVLEEIVASSNSPILFSDAIYLNNKLVEFYQDHCQED
jgi:hypothetical protein